MAIRHHHRADAASINISNMFIFIIGIFIGIVLGLTGAGGGILAVPALISSMNLTMQEAAPIALIAVAVSASVGTFEGLQKKLTRYRAALLMATVGIPFTALGIRLAHMLPQSWLMGLFAAVLFFIASRLLHRTFNAQAELLENNHTTLFAHIRIETGRFDWSWKTTGILSSIGVITGFMSGLLGVGGGFILIPLLNRFTALSIHSSVATSLMVIALVSTGGVIISLSHGIAIPGGTTMLFTGATVIGMIGGRFLTRILSETTVQRSFACLLLVIAVGMILTMSH